MRKVRKVFLLLRTSPSFPKLRDRLRKWTMAFACSAVQRLATDEEMVAVGMRFQMIGMRNAMQPMIEEIEKLKGYNVPDKQVKEEAGE